MGSMIESLCLGPAVSESSLLPEWESLIAGGFAWMCNNVGNRINPPARVPAVNSDSPKILSSEILYRMLVYLDFFNNQGNANWTVKHGKMDGVITSQLASIIYIKTSIAGDMRAAEMTSGELAQKAILGFICIQGSKMFALYWFYF